MLGFLKGKREKHNYFNFHCYSLEGIAQLFPRHQERPLSGKQKYFQSGLKTRLVFL